MKFVGNDAVMKAALGIGLPALPAAAKFVGNDAVMKAALGIGLPALPAAAKFVGNDAVMKAALGIGLGGLSGLLGDSHWSGPLAIGLNPSASLSVLVKAGQAESLVVVSAPSDADSLLEWLEANGATLDQMATWCHFLAAIHAVAAFVEYTAGIYVSRPVAEMEVSTGVLLAIVALCLHRATCRRER
jgi:hypothetical protein